MDGLVYGYFLDHMNSCVSLSRRPSHMKINPLNHLLGPGDRNCSIEALSAERFSDTAVTCVREFATNLAVPQPTFTCSFRAQKASRSAFYGIFTLHSASQPLLQRHLRTFLPSRRMEFSSSDLVYGFLRNADRLLPVSLPSSQPSILTY